MIKIYVDGGTRYCGICLYDPQKDMYRTKKRNSVQTNNELEYLAVIYALEYIRKFYPDNDVTIVSDSQLIVNHINGSYKCKQDNLLKLLSKVKEKMRDSVTLVWVRREENLAGIYLEKFY